MTALGMSRERGMVTAEAAVVAPFVLTLGLALLWCSALGIAQVRLSDAAREAARVVARGEPVESAERLARSQAPDGARIEVVRGEGLVEVRATVRAGLPFLPQVGTRRLEAHAVAADERP